VETVNTVSVGVTEGQGKSRISKASNLEGFPNTLGGLRRFCDGGLHAHFHFFFSVYARKIFRYL
jgi:hypothetical protein